MEINGNSSTVNLVSYVNQTNLTNQNESTKTTSTSSQISGSDKVELSSQAKEANRAFAELKTLPDIREEEVNEIQTQLETGTYSVDNEKIAVSMLNEALENNTILNAIDLEV
ncbi:MAG: flagellar biosynthesis anti-sigma factor FlgM [Desulfobacteraceae bacterium]|jgi:flagellar biosynthesis anti-sigma factor FlgM